MNRFSKSFSKLNTLPEDQDARFWYRLALMDVKIALLDAPRQNDFSTLVELHHALVERSNLCRN